MKSNLIKRNFPVNFLINYLIFCFSVLTAQTQPMAWGNINGIRINGALIDFETSIRVVEPGWMNYFKTAHEKQDPDFRREGSQAKINPSIENISFSEIIEDAGTGRAKIQIDLKADSNVTMAGAFFCMELPQKDFKDAVIQYIDRQTPEEKTTNDTDMPWWQRRFQITPVNAKGITITTPSRNLEITAEELTDIIVREANPFFGDANTVVYFTIINGNALAGQTGSKTLSLTAAGKFNADPVELSLDISKPGEVYDGIGGNFRLQNPELDPKVIDYLLTNLNVTWARVELPWRNWHREEDADPLEAARNGQVDESVENAMLMAQKLSGLGMPVILSAWFPPQWAAIGETFRIRKPGDPFGNPLDINKMRKIIKSIGSYILFLKERYGVEAVMFSFNESDLGINVRHKGEEHAQFIKELGNYFDENGLATKLLLGDNSDATTYSFLTPALNDLSTHKYIGAVSFHSWRGCDNMTLQIWKDIADELNVPLLVGEGSMDAQAHGYPGIFLEPSYAINEIDVYVRMLNICQARSILQWQLTSDYSVLTGGGIYGTSGKMRPTQRFWNLKQLCLTPKGSFHVPVKGKADNISSAAFADIKNGIYVIHLVNNSGERLVILRGIPETVKVLHVYFTDQNTGMEEVEKISVKDGTASFKLRAAGFTSVINE